LPLLVRKSKSFIKLENSLKKAGSKIPALSDSIAQDIAAEVVATIKDGIRKANLVRPPLSQATIKIKETKGYSRVRTPLMGRGDKEPKSMINSLGWRKTSKGYIISGIGTHYQEGNQKPIKNRDLWVIHEFGATIPVTDRMRGFLHILGIHLKASTTVIKIPARYPIRKGLQRFLNSGKLKDMMIGHKVAEILFDVDGKKGKATLKAKKK